MYRSFNTICFLGGYKMMETWSIVVTYNPDIAILSKGLNAVREQVSKLFVIDNNSLNQSDIRCLTEQLESNSVIFQANDDNKGLSAVYNEIFQKAKTMGVEWVLILDQDTVIPLTMLNTFLEYIYEDDVAIICPQIADRNAVSLMKEQKNEEIDYCINSGSFVRVEAWERINGYDENLFIDLVDYDFCKRIRQEGYKIKCISKEIISHSIGEKQIHTILGLKVVIYNHSAIRKYNQIRNCFYLDQKYYGHITIRPIKRMLICLIKVWIWENDKKNKTIAILRGMREGRKKEALAYRTEFYENNKN